MVKSLLAADLAYDKIYKPLTKAPPPSVFIDSALVPTTDLDALQKALYETVEFTVGKLQAIYILNVIGSGYLLPIVEGGIAINLRNTLNTYSALGLIAVMPAGPTIRAKTTIKGDQLLQTLLRQKEQAK